MAGPQEVTLGARLRSPLVVILLLAASGLGAARSARAGEAERTQAELLFQKAVDTLKAGRTAEACPLFEESDRLDAQPGTEYELARCYEAVGRTASAWSRYREVAEKIEARGEHAKAEKVRQRLREVVEPKLARLTVAVPEAVGRLPGLEVARDGIAVGRGLWGTAVPVDPGPHLVRVSATGKLPWETTVGVTTPGATVVVDVPELGDAQVTPPPRSPLPLPAPPPPPPPAPAPAGGAAQRLGGLVLGGAGVVGLGLGVGFGAAALARGAEWTRLVGASCNAVRDCTTTAKVNEIQGVERARGTLATASTVGFVAGAAAVGGGLILFLTAPRAPTEPARGAGVALAPWIEGGHAGLLVRGAFR